MKIRTKLFGGFFIIVAIGAFLGAVGYYSNTQLTSSYGEIQPLPLEKIEARYGALLNDIIIENSKYGILSEYVIMAAMIVAVIACVVLALTITSNIVNPIVEVIGTHKDISEGEGDLTRTITDNVKALKEASEAGRGGLKEVAADIHEIADEYEDLLKINMAMKRIASQTSLLSVNAAIEAAHAGEAGKGFAVIAEEICKLAESSSEQSKMVSVVLKRIKARVDKIGSSTENALNKFKAIDSSVQTVAEQNESKKFSDLTQEITSGMNEISPKNRERIAALLREVSRFKVA